MSDPFTEAKNSFQRNVLDPVNTFVDRASGGYLQGDDLLAGSFTMGTGTLLRAGVRNLSPVKANNDEAIARAEAQQAALLADRATQTNRKDYNASMMAGMFFREQGGGLIGGGRSNDMMNDFMGL